MKSIQIRITILTLFLISIIICINLIFIDNQKPYTSTIDPSFQENPGQSFSFYHQFLRIEITGNFESANWTLYKHDFVSNSSELLINTTAYQNPVSLELNVGFYTLMIGVTSNNPVSLTTSYYGLPERNLFVCLLFGVIGAISTIIFLIKSRFELELR